MFAASDSVPGSATLLASPDWNIRVVDESGKPLPGITVQLAFENYSIEDTSHEEQQITDESGFARFAKQSRWTVGFARICAHSLYDEVGAGLRTRELWPSRVCFCISQCLRRGDYSTGIRLRLDRVAQPPGIDHHAANAEIITLHVCHSCGNPRRCHKSETYGE